MPVRHIVLSYKAPEDARAQSRAVKSRRPEEAARTRGASSINAFPSSAARERARPEGAHAARDRTVALHTPCWLLDEKLHAQEYIAYALRALMVPLVEMEPSTKPQVVRFVVDGTPRGYCIQMGKYQNTKVKRRYVEYKKLVQAVADLSGLALPLSASKERPVRVITRAFFETGVHPDPENVHKGVKDALFYGAGGVGDKYTGGSYEPPLYDPVRPRVEIEVQIP